MMVKDVNNIRSVSTISIAKNHRIFLQKYLIHLITAKFVPRRNPFMIQYEHLRGPTYEKSNIQNSRMVSC